MILVQSGKRENRKEGGGCEKYFEGKNRDAWQLIDLRKKGKEADNNLVFNVWVVRRITIPLRPGARTELTSGDVLWPFLGKSR